MTNFGQGGRAAAGCPRQQIAEICSFSTTEVQHGFALAARMGFLRVLRLPRRRQDESRSVREALDNRRATKIQNGSRMDDVDVGTACSCAGKESCSMNHFR